MKEVVILGAGYAGLRALHVLQGSKGDFHITLVDKNDYHYEATDLHEVAAGTQPRERISYDIADVVRPQKQLSYKMKLQRLTVKVNGSCLRIKHLFPMII